MEMCFAHHNGVHFLDISDFPEQWSEHGVHKHILWLWTMCFAPQRRCTFSTCATSKSAPKLRCFVAFWLRNVRTSTSMNRLGLWQFFIICSHLKNQLAPHPPQFLVEPDFFDPLRSHKSLENLTNAVVRHSYFFAMYLGIQMSCLLETVNITFFDLLSSSSSGKRWQSSHTFSAWSCSPYCRIVWLLNFLSIDDIYKPMWCSQKCQVSIHWILSRSVSTR